jgi:aryl carrier-like protein
MASTNKLNDAASIAAWLRRAVADRLQIEDAQIDVKRSLLDYGLDSFHATALSGELGRKMGRRLSPVLLWDYPTIDALSRHLSGEDVEPERVTDELSAEFGAFD